MKWKDIKTIDKVCLFLIALSILVAVGGSFIVWLNDPAIFCTKVNSISYDINDTGDHCFETLAERNEFLEYLANKYGSTEAHYMNLPSNYSLNIS